MFPEFEIVPIVTIKSLVTAFQKKLDNNYYYTGEIHDFWEFVYVMDGKIGVAADAKVFELEKGDIIFHKPREFHKIWSHQGKKPTVFIMAFSTEGKSMSLFENAIFNLSENETPKIKVLIDYFYSIQVQSPPGEDFIKYWNPTQTFVQIGTNHLNTFLLWLMENKAPKQIEETEEHTSSIYRKAIAVMNDNVYRNISTQQIATECGVSLTQLKRIFSKYSPYSIHKHFLNIKILKAINLLEDGFSVREISDMLSFKNPNYFSVVFKREIGYSPVNYRNTII